MANYCYGVSLETLLPPVFQKAKDGGLLCRNGKLLREPVSLPCGERLCMECAKEMTNKKLLCAECQELHSEDDISEDRYCKRQLMRLMVICEHKENGCTWTGELKDYTLHLVRDHTTLMRDQEDLATMFIEESMETVVCDSFSGNSDPMIGIMFNKFHKDLEGNKVLIQVITREVTTLSHAITQQNKDLNDCSQAISDQNGEHSLFISRLNTLENNYLSLQSQLRDMQLQILDKSIPSVSDGKLTWIIKGFSAHQSRAISGETPVIYSPVFYTSPDGYRLQCRLYINGDGMGKGSHLSLYIMIIKGPFDAILKWPFPFRVTFCLVDQTGSGNDIKEAFRSNPQSSSFKRPVTEQNVATGCPRFISHESLNRRKLSYINEDTMFIKVAVE